MNPLQLDFFRLLCRHPVVSDPDARLPRMPHSLCKMLAEQNEPPLLWVWDCLQGHRCLSDATQTSYLGSPDDTINLGKDQDLREFVKERMESAKVILDSLVEDAPSREPRWTRCQSFGKPLSEEYWHIGDTAMRLRRTTSFRRNSVNKRPFIVAPSSRGFLGDDITNWPQIRLERTFHANFRTSAFRSVR